MPVIQLPSAQVAAGHLPPVCPRHGHPATEGKKVKLLSKPPAWAIPLIIFGVLPYAIVLLIVRKTVKAPAWPWCQECGNTRSKRLAIGLPVGLLGLVLFFAGPAMGNDLGLVVMLAGFVALLTGLIIAVRAQTQTVADAFVSMDGSYVEVKKGSDHFLHALNGGYARR